MNEKPENLIDRAFPSAMAIAHIKAELSKQISKSIIREVEKTRKLNPSERDSITRAVDEIVSQQPPEAFGIDFGWVPKSEAEVRERLVKLRYDRNFKDMLIKNVMDQLRAKQKRIDSVY